MSADIAVIGLAVMGENLILNMANHGFTVAVFNRTVKVVDTFINGRVKEWGHEKNIIGCHSPEELAKNLKRPRKVIIMVRAGSPVDDTIAKLIPVLEKGDIIIDGGNSNYEDTNRRIKQLEEQGLMFFWLRNFRWRRRCIEGSFYHARWFRRGLETRETYFSGNFCQSRRCPLL